MIFNSSLKMITLLTCMKDLEALKRSTSMMRSDTAVQHILGDS